MVNLQLEGDSTDFDLPIEIANGNALSGNDLLEQTEIAVLLVDDQNSILETLHISLKPQSDLKIVGKAVDGQTAISLIDIYRPDIALIDIEMPGMNGLEATQIIKERYPDTRIIILSSYDDDHYIEQALRAGANGYLLKTTPTAEIVNAIRNVNQGNLQLSPELFKRLILGKLGKQQSETSEPNLPKGQQIIKQKLNESSELIPATNEQTNQSQQSSSLAVIPKTTSSLVRVGSSNADSNEWSSLTKELIETLPQVWTRGLLYSLMVIVGIVLPWAMLSKVDETGSARGKLEPQGKVFTVDAPISGTVDEVFVKEGQQVKKHQPLLSLESEPVESELQQVQTELSGQQKELAQLKLLKNQLLLTVNTQKQQNTAQLFEKQAQLDQARQNVQHSRLALNLAQKAYDEAEQEVQRYVQAKSQGIVAQIQVVEKEDELRERERLLEEASSEHQQAQLRAVEQEESYQSLTHSGDIAVLRSQEQLKEIDQQIVGLRSQIKANQSQLDGLEYQLEQRVVKSPANGSIFQLPPQETGTVLEPGGLVAEIAPEQSSLILKAQMIPTESGSLDPGMPVKMKFDAYPFQDYGIVEGKLVSISPTTKMVETEQGKAESYEIEVELEQDYIQAKNQRVTLRPGQTATAEVIVRQRRLIDFVLDPFKKLNKDGLEL